MDIKQELINQLDGNDCTLTVEQVEAIVAMIDDNTAKDNVIIDLQNKLKTKDDLITKLYGAIINNFIKENS